MTILLLLELSTVSFSQIGSKKDTTHLQDVEISLSLSSMFRQIGGVYELSLKNNSWSATFYDNRTKKLKKITNSDSILSATFLTLKDNNLFILPDQQTLKLKGSIDDGMSYSLMYTIGTNSRSYTYENPDLYLEINKGVKELEYFCNILTIFKKLFP